MGDGEEGGGAGYFQHPLRGLRARGRPVGRGGGDRAWDPPRLISDPSPTGSRATAGCGASTPGTPSRARTPQRARCTTATRPSPAPGTTPWDGLGWTRCLPRPRRSRPSSNGGTTSSRGARRYGPRSTRRAGELKKLGVEALGDARQVPPRRALRRRDQSASPSSPGRSTGCGPGSPPTRPSRVARWSTPDAWRPASATPPAPTSPAPTCRPRKTSSG